MLGIQLSGFALSCCEFIYGVIANVIGGFNTYRALFIPGYAEYHPSIIAHFVQFTGDLCFFALFIFGVITRRLKLSEPIAFLAIIPLLAISVSPFPHARYYSPFMPIFMFAAITAVTKRSAEIPGFATQRITTTLANDEA